MALVYKAECSLLCRTVAIKILRPQYASDADFVERFRREARSAASLSHPNVVNIYDVGQENGTDYIVMEYIPGDNLKNLIKKEAPFSARRALDICRQIAEALNHAHQRNIIHRDIKPHNILVMSDGQIKVTDFGIARAISASSFTQAGMVIGTVQYASPEQSRGGEVGPQSDIYSLGCVLYELLTGRVPFKGDTPVAIAMQHLENEYTPVSKIRPEISMEVEQIVQKAMAKNLAFRYPSALAMLRELKAAQSRTTVDSELLVETDQPTQTWKPIKAKDTVPLPKDKPEKINWWWLLLGFGASLMVVIISAMLIINYLNRPRPLVTVPNLVGKELVEAREILKRRQLRVKIIGRIYNPNYSGDTVISQKPDPGREKRSNSEVEVVVSKGPKLVRVPDLIGKTQREAELALEEAGLELGDILAGSNQDFPPGAVIKQLPEGNTQIERGAGVSITLNGVSDLVQVPNFIGRSLSEVRAELNSLGLFFNQATPMTSNIYAEGVITDQRPVPYDKVPKGTAMNFMVSTGAPST